MRRRSQQGVALITAVMVVAFASTVATGLMVQQNLAVHRTANLLQEDQAWWYLVGLEQWAATLLDRDAENNEIDHLGEPWAEPVDFLPVDQGALSGSLEDLQGRFNLRALATGESAARREQFLRLVAAIDGLENAAGADIASAIIDWIDADTEPQFPGGAEDSVYLSKDPPYRAANRLPASLSELLLIHGIDHKIYSALRPHITVHPGEHQINVNTATAPVLLSLHPEMQPAQVEAILARREEQPYESANDFITDEILAELDTGLFNEADFTVQSSYFLARGAASIGNVRVSVVSLLRREGGRTVAIASSRNSL